MKKEISGTRSELVCDHVRAYTEELFARGRPVAGVDAGSVSVALALDRANVSKELNDLYRSGQMVKMLGKPTLYLHRAIVCQHYPGVFVPTTIPKGKTLEELIGATPSPSAAPSAASALPMIDFDVQIGIHGSLRKAALRAKAAITYPPHGLHMLVCGNTGSGKMHFVRMIHEYAIVKGLFQENAPFVVCDCQDYGASPQLLLAKIFGYAKDATPTSARSHRGLLEKASGGILCLDAAQSLPLPVQNQLAALLEKNTFTRVGENTVVRTSNAMIVTISTAPPDSPEIQKVARNIPVHIAIPDLNERGLSELFEYISLFFQRESANIGVSFRVEKCVLATLLCATYRGNVAELRSVIKSICSMAYLAYSSSSQRADTIGVRSEHVPGDLLACIFPNIRIPMQVQALLELFPADFITFSPQLYMPPTLAAAGSPAASPGADAPHARIPLVIALYGDEIAERMAALLNQLCGDGAACGISFPAGTAFDELLAVLSERIRGLRAENGVLLATDILPLEQLYGQLMETCGTEIQLLQELRLPALQSACEQAVSFAGTAQELFERCLAGGKGKIEGEPITFIKRIISEILTPSLTFLNPEKAATVLLDTLGKILADLAAAYSDEIAIKFIFHCSHMLERLIRGNSFKYEHLKSFTNEHGQVYICVEKRMRYPAEVFGVSIPASEIAYVAELFVQEA